MLLLGILIGQLALLFFLSRWLNGSLFALFYRLFHSKQIAITLTTLILFPGTVIHELSHLFIAEILQVRTGKLSLFPVVHEDSYIEAGSVEVARTDPLRRTIIGIAPLFIGVIVVTLLSQHLARMYPEIIKNIPTLTHSTIQPFTLLFFFLGYILFAVTNNMFPSKEDMKGVPAVFIVLGMLLATAYFVGVRFTLSGQALIIIENILTAVTGNLLFIMILNLVILAMLQSFLFLTKKI